MKRHYIHTVILGSGAAGLAAAVRLYAAGIHDVALLTEGLTLGTSLNTGSDKQTYYKLGIGGEPDSPAKMAESYLAGGSADGRLALVESCGSVGAFFHLAQLGVPFPHDRYGGYAGYKTDHDPCRRATSCGPYTSREMCRALYRDLCRRAIPVHDGLLAVKLFTVDEANAESNGKSNGASNSAPHRRIAGLIAIRKATGEAEIFTCENLVFAVGGPGGLYDASVYPSVHIGGIGLALEIGAEAVSLPESQFGLASVTDVSDRIAQTSSDSANNNANNNVNNNADADNALDPAPCAEFRWNVSGSYMQTLPRVISTKSDGVSDPVEFLRSYFSTPSESHSALFLKGYQWPFDVRRAVGGSSLIDLAVRRETNHRRRRVFLDFRTNPDDLDFNALSAEAREYLEKSNALFGRPIDRLRAMNPAAIALYRDHGVDLEREPLEIRLCAQHNNGGLAGNLWYESVNIGHLFPIGEVNGSHGVARPGGSALNAGQVGAFRAAEFIAARYSGTTLDRAAANRAADEALASLTVTAKEQKDWHWERRQIQRLMSENAGPLRCARTVQRTLNAMLETAKLLWAEPATVEPASVKPASVEATSIEVASEQSRGAQLAPSAEGRFDADAAETLRNRTLLTAALCYLSAILFQIESGTGSRGSALVLDPETGTPIHPNLPSEWRFVPEDAAFRAQTLRTVFEPQTLAAAHHWENAAPIPIPNDWFETIWREYQNQSLYAPNTEGINQ